MTAIQLICENNKNDATRKIASELLQIGSHVEKTLYYARLEYVKKDFIIRQISLNSLVSQVPSKYRPLLTRYSIAIEIDNLDFIVYTDNKWIEFILGQIITNAVKYRKEHAKIYFSASMQKNMVILSIKDNGIGIDAAELPRVFEKGFTGSNGREKGGTTGIGLYLCYNLANKIESKIKIISQKNEYTELLLYFSTTKTLTKM